MAQLEEERKILEAEETETASEGEGFFEKVDEQRILPRYRAVRSHEIASACANSVQAYAILVDSTFLL